MAASSRIQCYPSSYFQLLSKCIPNFTLSLTDSSLAARHDLYSLLHSKKQNSVPSAPFSSLLQTCRLFNCDDRRLHMATGCSKIFLWSLIIINCWEYDLSVVSHMLFIPTGLSLRCCSGFFGMQCILKSNTFAFSSDTITAVQLRRLSFEFDTNVTRWRKSCF